MEAQTPDSVKGYFEENNITVEGAGVEKENTLKEFTYLSSVKSTDEDGKVLDVEFTGAIGISEKIEGETKKITAEINPTWEVEDLEIGEHYEYCMYGFVDRYTCPSDYDGAAFFVCGTNEELSKENEKNLDKFVSISEIKHGDYDMKFFAQ